MGEEAKDKLTMKYQRYFFKEGKEMSKIKDAEKLVDLASESFEIFGKAIKAEKKVDQILDAIDEAGAIGRLARGVGSFAKGAAKDAAVGLAVGGALAGASALSKRSSAKSVCSKYPKGSDKYKACMHKLVHNTQEGEKVDFGKGTIDTTGRPYDHPKKIRVVADVEECGMMGGGPMNKGISGGEMEMDSDEYGFDAEQTPERNDNPRKIANKINHVPNQNAKSLYHSIITQLSEFIDMNESDKAAYKAYFDGMLKKFGVSSPKELDGEKKRQFFNAVDKGWKSKKESK